MTRRRPPYQSRRRVVRYGDDPSQVGELFLPAGGAPSPVAVVLHGGFWRMATGRHLTDDLCIDLARAGWAALEPAGAPGAVARRARHARRRRRASPAAATTREVASVWEGPPKVVMLSAKRRPDFRR